MHREHHVERAAFGHACGGCVREHRLAKDTQRGLTELLVQIGRLDAAEALLDRTAGTIVSPSRG
jgi:hypothetical protein